MDLLVDFEPLLRSFGLHVLRILAAVWTLSIFGAGSASRLQRLGLGVVIGASVALSRDHLASYDPGSDPIVLGLTAGKEVFIGLLLGWITSLIVEIGTIAGTVISTEMGMNLADQIDPTTKHNVPLIGFFFRNLAMILFFTTGGHYLLLRSFVLSFEAMPVGQLPSIEHLASFLVSWAGTIVTTGIRLAAPIFLIMVVVTMSVGFLGKMAPRLRILEASFPIRIISSMVIMVLFMPAMAHAMDVAFESLGNELLVFVTGR